MDTKGLSTRLWAEVAFAGFIIVASALLLFSALDLPTMSALLPVAMLGCLIALGVALIFVQFMRRQSVADKDLKVGDPARALGAFSAIIIYTLAVQYIGFYISTIIMVPTVAWLFDFRNIRGLALATVIFVGGTFLIFSMLMGQRFPEEIFLR